MKKTTEKILLFTADFIFINLAGMFYFLLRVESGFFSFRIQPEFLPPLVVIYLYWLLIFTFVGMYRAWFASSRFDEISTLFKATFVGIFIRSFQRRLLIKGIGRKNALVVGYNPKAFEVFDQIAEHKALGLDIVGFVSDETNKNDSYKNIPVIGRPDKIQELIEKYNVNEIIIAMEKKNADILLDLLAEASMKNVGLKIVPNLYEILTGQARTSQIYGMPLVDLMPQLMPEWERKLKRLFDIIVSFLVLVLTLPFVFIIALAIKLDSPGTIFFTQNRCGQDGRIFKMIKFRSMFSDAEKKKRTCLVASGRRPRTREARRCSSAGRRPSKAIFATRPHGTRG